MPDSLAQARTSSSSLVTLPNIITFARLCAVPMAVWLVVRQEFLPAFWLCAAAGVSDGLDGWLARRRGPTYLGAVLDPVADKALLVSMYVTLALVGVLPDWMAILVVFRDTLIVGGVLVLALLRLPLVIRPLLVSKLNTRLQLRLVAGSLLVAGAGWSLPLGPLVWVTAVTTLASGAAYVWQTARRG